MSAITIDTEELEAEVTDEDIEAILDLPMTPSIETMLEVYEQLAEIYFGAYPAAPTSVTYSNTAAG